jgi:hypothetical protein
MRTRRHTWRLVLAELRAAQSTTTRADVRDGRTDAAYAATVARIRRALASAARDVAALRRARAV